jgi:rod shape-determining protein MreB
VKFALENTPPELSADIVDNGMMVAGGGALLTGLEQLLREATGVPVTLAPDPLCAVVLGTGKALDELELLKQITVE